jgi:hypothetical protein
MKHDGTSGEARGHDAADERLRAALAQTRAPLPPQARDRMWFGIQGRLRAPARFPLAWATAGAVAFSIAILWAAWSIRPSRPGLRAVDVVGAVQVGAGADARPLITDETVALPVRLEVAPLGTARVALSRGAQLRIAGGSTVRIEKDGARLDSGSAMHDVAPGRGRYVVQLGRFDVVVLGTVFWTGREGREAAVCLLEGSVVVRRGEKTVARLAPGEGWRSSDAAPAFPEDLHCGGQPPDRVAVAIPPLDSSPRDVGGDAVAHEPTGGDVDLEPSEAGPDARPIAGGAPRGPARIGTEMAAGPAEEPRTPPVAAVDEPAGPVTPAADDDANASPPPAVLAPPEAEPRASERDECQGAPRSEQESCYRDAALSRSLRAQNAHFRLGELQLARGAAGEALETWREYRRLYPQGLYLEEADLGILEARLRLGSGDVLRAADEFLARHPGSQRAGEVRAIRGALLQGLGRCDEALAAYERALGGTLSARRRVEAEYGTAACLESEHRTADAIAAYRRFLERHPNGRRSGLAREALERLGAEH